MTQAPTRPAMLTLDRLGPSFGAEVIGLDLRVLDDEQVTAVREALVAHKVLFFRGQDLTDADQVELGRRLGEPTAGHPVASSATVEHPEIYDIDSADPEFSFSDVWHTDVTFMEKPPLGSILRAVRLPSYGGDTSWVDSQLAYESLSAPVRRLVDQLTAVHDGNREWGAYLRRHGGRGNVWDGEQVTELAPVEHPVVRVHPETGRKGLFVNPGFTSHVVGVSDAESRGDPRPPLRPPHQARAHDPAPLAGRRRRHLGQPQHVALRQPRLHRGAHDAADHAGRRPAGRTRPGGRSELTTSGDPLDDYGRGDRRGHRLTGHAGRRCRSLACRHERRPPLPPCPGTHRRGPRLRRPAPRGGSPGDSSRPVRRAHLRHPRGGDGSRPGGRLPGARRPGRGPRRRDARRPRLRRTLARGDARPAARPDPAAAPAARCSASPACRRRSSADRGPPGSGSRCTAWTTTRSSPTRATSRRPSS